MKTISVITSMHNRNRGILETIEEMFFPSLLKNASSRIELVLIDDYSPLEYATRDIVEKYLWIMRKKFGNVIFIRNQSNLGFSKSFNRGIRMAQGERLIIANDDLYFPSHSIARLTETLDKNEGYFIAGPITNSSGVWSYQYCRQAPTLKSYALNEIAQLEKFSLWLHEKMRGQVLATDNLCGFCLATDAAFIRELGGFDEDYRHGFFEDTDLIQRIARYYGKEKIAIGLDVFVGHGGVKGCSQTMASEFLKSNYYFFANAVRYANRWGYGKLLKRIHYGIRSEKGIGTISELLPENIAL